MMIVKGDFCSGAMFSECEKYRYVLWRRWEPNCESSNIVSFIGLNPSTADEVKLDPTVTRCVNWAKAWGFGGMAMLNCFAYRATDPKDMKRQADPVGNGNRAALLVWGRESGRTVLCWGNHGTWEDRNKEVLEILGDRNTFYHFGLTKTGQPKHPLYLPNNIELQKWK